MSNKEKQIKQRLKKAETLLESLKGESFGEQYSLADFAATDEYVKEHLDKLAIESAIYQDVLREINVLLINIKD